MVSVLDNQTGMSQQSFEASLDRPKGRSIFYETTWFKEISEDVLPFGYGVIAQTRDIKEGAVTSLAIDTTLNDSCFEWQYTTASRDTGRHVRSLRVHPDGRTNSWSATFDRQGRLVTTAIESEQDIDSLWDDIQQFLKNPSVQLQIEATRQKKVRFERSLGLFGLLKSITYQIPTDQTSRPDKAIRRVTDKKGIEYSLFQTQLSDAGFEKEFEKRFSQYTNLGFTALHLMPKPKELEISDPTLF